MISVVVPVYNTSEFLRDCLDSLLSQTYVDLEIICVNDGSTDNSLSILEEYQQKDSRIKILNQANQGLSMARNNGFKLAQGEYISFIDSDDWVSNDYLQKLHDALVRSNCDIACASILRKSKTSERYRIHYKAEMVYSSLQEKLDICRIPVCCYVWNKLYKRELIENFPFSAGMYFEDVLWTPYVLAKSASIVTVPNITYYYRSNANSIVKKTPSEKKQRDLYFAKKKLFKFYEENGLFLAKSQRRVTKSLRYFKNILLMKEKDCDGIISHYLLGFIRLPKFVEFLYNELKVFLCSMFSINKIDNHWLIYLLGIQIRKRMNVPTPLLRVKSLGVDENSGRSPRIIASLTSFPERITLVAETIKSLLLQTVKPDMLILWLAEEQFPNKEKDLPPELLNLRQYGLTIDWCNDIRSYKKLIPALKKYPEDIIITFDDDIYYDKNVIELLYNSYQLEPTSIHTNRASRFCKNKDSMKFCKNSRLYWTRYKKSSFKNSIIGCGGVLYPPNSLYSDTTREDLFKDIVPTQDDLWFWAMAVLAGTKIKVVASYDMQIATIKEAQAYGLCKLNAKNSKGLSGQDALQSVLRNYPELVQKTLKD